MKLYPPHLEGTLPSFYITSQIASSITIPFSMNQAVSINEVGGFSLWIKEVISGKDLFKINTLDYKSSSEVTFELSTFELLQLKVGSYYKVQLAYLDTSEPAEVGYYSSVAIMKCTAKPEIKIQGLDLKNSNIHRYDYTGYYSNLEDPSEKVYSYRFIINDTQGNIIKDSKDIIHNIERDENNYESTDTYNFPFDLDLNKTYFIQYIITTNNNMVLKTPKYRIIQSNSGEMIEPIKLSVKPNFDNGYVNIVVNQNQHDEKLYDLCVLKEYDNILTYYEKIYEPILLSSDEYKKNTFYILNNNEYILSRSDFDITEDYYKIEYNKIKLDKNTYLANYYYLKREYYARGNFLISRSSKDTNYKEWNPIATIRIDGYKRELYNENDYTVEQGKKYKYAIQQYNHYGILSNRQETDEIYVDFEDAFLYDGERQLKIRYNPKISSFKTNIFETKTDTIGNKYPYFFRNGNIGYKEFPIAGLISYEMDSDFLFVSEEELNFSSEYKNFTRESTQNDIGQIKDKIKKNLLKINSNERILYGSDSEGHVYQSFLTPKQIQKLEEENEYLSQENQNLKSNILPKAISREQIVTKSKKPTKNLEGENIATERYFKLKVLEWLNNGKPKIFRSPGEGNYLVRLMNSSLSPEDSLGRMLHSFSTTAYEIGDFDYNTLKNFNIIKVDEINHKFLLWQTIRLSYPKGRTRSSKDENIYYLDENNKTKIVYRGDIEYKYNELLKDRLAYTVSFNDMIPGTIIYLDDQEIVISRTGSYYSESQKGFSSILIPSNEYYKGSVTFSYYGITTDSFDLVTNEYLQQVGIKQFIGNNTDIIKEITTPISSVKDFGFLHFIQKEIFELSVYNPEYWEKIYYTDNTYKQRVYFIEDFDENTINNNIYYYESDRTDVYEKFMGNKFEENVTYYENNKMGLNPMLMIHKNNKDNYPFLYKESFHSIDEEDQIIIPNNIVLYKYTTQYLLKDNEIKELDKLYTVYRDFYNDKYYLIKEDYESIEDENILSYFEKLSFEIILNNKEHISVENRLNYKIKGTNTFDSIILGNGVILNCSYQIYRKVYAFEEGNNIIDKYYDQKLQDIKNELEYYESILNHTNQEIYDNIVSLDVESIINYYKDYITDEVLYNTSFQNGQLIDSEAIKEYANFLNLYREYNQGNILYLTDLLNQLPSEQTKKDIRSLIKEYALMEENARQQYNYYYDMYIKRIAELIQIYEEESDIKNE